MAPHHPQLAGSLPVRIWKASYGVSTTQGRGPEPGCAVGGGGTGLLHLLCAAPAGLHICASMNCRTGRRRSECSGGSMEKRHDSHTASLLPRDSGCLDLFALPLLLEVT